MIWLGFLLGSSRSVTFRYFSFQPDQPGDANGAGRGRLVAQFLIESLVLAEFGTLAGLAFALPAMRFLERLVPESMGAARLTLDWRVLAFSASVAIGAALTFRTRARVTTVTCSATRTDKARSMETPDGPSICPANGRHEEQHLVNKTRMPARRLPASALGLYIRFWKVSNERDTWNQPSSATANLSG